MTSSLEAEYLRFVRGYRVATLFGDQPPDDALDPFDFRALEADRRYTSYSAVGAEEPALWLSRLGTVASRKGPYQGPIIRSLRQTLKHRVADVQRGIQRVGRPWPAVHVDLFPTGDLNAMSMPVPGGHLVLVNTGLMNLVFGVLKIHVLSQRIGPSDKERALVTERQVGLLLAEALNAYIYGGGGWMAWSTPELQGGRRQLVETTLDLCEDFVLAHEIGHVLGGDRLTASYVAAPPEAPVPGLNIPVADHDAEFRADRDGAEIVRAAFDVGDSISPTYERSLFGGLLFFSSLTRRCGPRRDTWTSPLQGSHSLAES